MKKTIYFVRHGESEGNIRTVVQGLTEPLTPQGREQGVFIAERVSKLPVQALIASPLMRTKETAEIIGKKIGMAPVYSDLFVECLGPSSFWSIERSDPRVEKGFTQINDRYGEPGWRYENEENFDDHIVRGKKCYELLAAHTAEHIVVVTHGLFLRVLLALAIFDFDPKPQEIQALFRNLHTQNTGITIVFHDNEQTYPWSLWVYNDHAHLAE